MPLNHSSKFAELTEKQLSLIGRLTVEWSNVEYLLGVLLSRLLFSNEYLSRTYTSRAPAVSLISKIHEALEVHEVRYSRHFVDEDFASSIRLLLKRIDKIRQNRNRIIHFCLARSHDHEIFGSALSGGALSKKRTKRDSFLLTNEELDDVGVECYCVVDELELALNELPAVSEEQLFSAVKEDLG